MRIIMEVMSSYGDKKPLISHHRRRSRRAERKLRRIDISIALRAVHKTIV